MQYEYAQAFSLIVDRTPSLDDQSNTHRRTRTWATRHTYCPPRRMPPAQRTTLRLPHDQVTDAGPRGKRAAPGTPLQQKSFSKRAGVCASVPARPRGRKFALSFPVLLPLTPFPLSLALSRHTFPPCLRTSSAPYRSRNRAPPFTHCCGPDVIPGFPLATGDTTGSNSGRSSAGIVPLSAGAGRGGGGAGLRRTARFA